VCAPWRDGVCICTLLWCYVGSWLAGQQGFCHFCDVNCMSHVISDGKIIIIIITKLLLRQYLRSTNDQMEVET